MTRARKGIHHLTARQVQVAIDGDHADGGGLLLRIRGASASWVWRYTSMAGKRREMGLGPSLRHSQQAAGDSLRNARDLAHEARTLLSRGVDPIEARQSERTSAREAEEAKKFKAASERATLARFARQFHERVIEPSRTTKHAAQWIASLENHVPQKLWHKPAADINAPELLDWMLELHLRLPETASRIRQRLEAVFDEAVFRGHCLSNPAAAIRRKIREGQKRRERGVFAALPWQEIPEFARRLRGQEGVAARALEFALLTAARTGEVIGSTWAEFDLEAAVWTVPAARMKCGESHVVHLSPRAIEIVESQIGIGSVHAFPSPMDRERPVSNMAMLTLLRRMNVADRTTVHGMCRSSFSTWANETAAARPDVIEACLAHKEGDKVRRAYNRAAFTADRRRLLVRWSEFIDGKLPLQQAEIFDMRAAA